MRDSFKTILIWIIKIGLFIIPFIPLYVSRSLFFPFITGKAFIFRFLIEVVFTAWILLAIFYKEFRPKKTLLFWTLTLFIVIVTLATIFGVNPYKSFWSNFERMEGLITYFHLFAYFLVLAHCFTKKNWLIFFNLFVVSGLAQNIYALFQRLGFLASPQGGFRVDGTIGNPTYVAAYSIFVLAITIFLIMNTKHIWAKYFYIFMLGFTSLTIYFTATRGAILALAIGIFIAGVIYLFKSKSKDEKTKLIKKIVLFSLIGLIIIGAGLKLFQKTSIIQSSEILSRLSSISLKEGMSRFAIWNMSWQGFKERPILGWGPGNYNLVFAKYYNPALYSQEPWFDRSHNIIFDWLINAGILGLLAYLSIFIAGLYLVWKKYLDSKNKSKEEMIAKFKVAALISILFLVYFMQNLFVFDQLATYIGFFAILAFIQSWYIGEREAHKDVSKDFLTFKLAGAVIAGIILIFTVYSLNYKVLATNLNLLDGIKYGSIGDANKAFQSFENALSYNTFGNSEISEQLSQFAIAVLRAGEIDQNFKQQIFNKVHSVIEGVIESSPRDPRLRLFLGILLVNAGQFDGAIRAFEKALELSPTKQQIHFELADVYIRQGDYKTAATILERAYLLATDFDLASENLVAVYILGGEQEKADEVLKKEHGKVDIASRLLAQVYSTTGQYGRLLEIWKAFIVENPTEVEYRRNVAAVLLELGKPNEAIETLEKAIGDIPSFKEEGEAYIKEIRGGA